MPQLANNAQAKDFQALKPNRNELKSTIAKESQSSKTPSRDPEPLSLLKSVCGACSCENEQSAIICDVCSNVLRPHLVPDHWTCASEACRGSSCINAGDYGRCQVCGEPKP
jgi:hypothetical protein